MIRRSGSISLAAVLALTVVACVTTTEVVGEQIVVMPAPGEVPPFPECEAEAFAFAGETSLAAIGLAHLAGPAEANVVGQIWVTAGPVPWMGGPPGAGEVMSDGRMLCMQFPDGGGMAATIDDAWQPPGAEVIDTTAPAWPFIGVVAVLVVLLGASFLAFRRG